MPALPEKPVGPSQTNMLRLLARAMEGAVQFAGLEWAISIEICGGKWGAIAPQLAASRRAFAALLTAARSSC